MRSGAIARHVTPVPFAWFRFLCGFGDPRSLSDRLVHVRGLRPRAGPCGARERAAPTIPAALPSAAARSGATGRDARMLTAAAYERRAGSSISSSAASARPPPTSTTLGSTTLATCARPRPSHSPARRARGAPSVALARERRDQPPVDPAQVAAARSSSLPRGLGIGLGGGPHRARDRRPARVRLEAAARSAPAADAVGRDDEMAELAGQPEAAPRRARRRRRSRRRSRFRPSPARHSARRRRRRARTRPRRPHRRRSRRPPGGPAAARGRRETGDRASPRDSSRRGRARRSAVRKAAIATPTAITVSPPSSASRSGRTSSAIASSASRTPRTRSGQRRAERDPPVGVDHARPPASFRRHRRRSSGAFADMAAP